MAPKRKLKHTTAILNLGLHFPVPLAVPLGRCQGELAGAPGPAYAGQKLHRPEGYGERRRPMSQSQHRRAISSGSRASGASLVDVHFALDRSLNSALGDLSSGSGPLSRRLLGTQPGRTLRTMRSTAALRTSRSPVRGLSSSSALGLRPLTEAPIATGGGRAPGPVEV